MLISCEECGQYRPEGCLVAHDDGEPIYICESCAHAAEVAASWQDQFAKAEEAEPEA